jgi:predicted metal-dependent hydrolase
MDPLTKGRLFQKGLEAFNTEHFYDAHEYWEEVWLETQDPDKMFLQGLIQVAAAFHHYSRANSLGCRNLLQAGLLKLECFPEQYWGLAIEPLRSSVRQWLVPLREGENRVQLEIPRIRLRGDRPARFRMPSELK